MNHVINNNTTRALVAVLAGTLWAATAMGANKTWTSTLLTGDWDTTSVNWSALTFGPGDTPRFAGHENDTFNITLTEDITASNLNFFDDSAGGATGSYNFSGDTASRQLELTSASGTANLLLENNNTIVINMDTVLSAAGTSRVGWTLRAGSNITVNGDLTTTTSGWQLRDTGVITLNGGNTIAEEFRIGSGSTMLYVNGTTTALNTTGNAIAVQILSGSTLGGTGTLGAGSGKQVHLTGATVNPGTPTQTIGTLTLGTVGNSNSIRFLSGGTLAIDVTTLGVSDRIDVVGDLNLSTVLDGLNIIGTLDGNSNYTIATYTGTLTGTFDTIIGLPGNYAIDYGTGSNSSISIQVQQVPEPTSVVCLGALGVLLIARQRRQASRQRH